MKMGSNLTAQTINGIKWSYVSTLFSALLQLIYSAVMARLLGPSAFGLLAIGLLVLRFGGYFAQMGIGRALIQKENLTDEDIKASFTFSVLLGFSFSLLIYFASPLFSLMFNNGKVENIIKVLALSFVFTGFSSTSLSILKRKLNFKALAKVEITSYLVGYVLIGIPFAISGFGVWSLVFAVLMQGLITSTVSYLITRHSIKFTFNKTSYKPLFAFGSKVSFISILEFLGSNLDTLIIGRLLGPASLGIYNRAFMVVNMPMQQFATSISKVLFSSFSRVQKEIMRLKKAYLSSVSVAGFILFPVCAGIAVSAESIVLVVLGEKWRSAIPVLQILAFATPFNLLSHFGGIVCEASANLNAKIKLQAAYLVILICSLLLLSSYDLAGVAFAVLISEFIRKIFYLITIRRILSLSSEDLLSAYKPGLFTGVITSLLLLIVNDTFNYFHFNSFSMLIINLLMGAGAILILLFTKPNKVIRSEISMRLEKSFDDKIKFRNSFVSKISKLLAVTG